MDKDRIIGAAKAVAGNIKRFPAVTAALRSAR